MTSDCLFCGSDLPQAAPSGLGPGERLAFDPALGRLWVTCVDCGRWNLTPIESRWETVESCETMARSAPVLLRTANLALLACGTGQLIRVGAPLRTEFAVWRYGSRLERFGAVRGRLDRLLLGLPELPVGGYDFHGTVRAVPASWLGSPFLEHGSLLSALFSIVPLSEECPACGYPLFIHPAAFGDLRLEPCSGSVGVAAPCGLCGEQVIVEIGSARPAIRVGLALVSRTYRDATQVRRAVAPLDRLGGAEPLLERLCARRAVLGELPVPGRVGLWIALDEMAEAEALEAEWSSAETLARIADGELTVIPGFEAFRRRVLRERTDTSRA